MRNFRLLILLFAFVFGSSRAYAQMHKGLSFNLGFALGSSQWDCYKHLFTDFNEQRPWLTTPADYTDLRYGVSLGLGTSSERMLYQYNAYGYRSSLFVEGTDTAGYLVHNSYIMKSRGFELMFGPYLVNRDKFRIALLFGLNINKVALRSSDKSLAERASMTTLRILFLAPARHALVTIEDHFYLGGRLALPIAFGEKRAFSVEPFFSMSFWKVNLEDDRQALSGTYPATHDNAFFKSTMLSYGIRMAFCFGLTD